MWQKNFAVDPSMNAAGNGEIDHLIGLERAWSQLSNRHDAQEQTAAQQRAVATKQGAMRKMTHTHEILVHSRFVFRRLLTMTAVKTDVNPSDIGTKALGRERFHRLRSMLGMGTELSETSFTWQIGTVATNDSGNLWIRV